jgi:peroxiredoxin
MKNKLFRTRHYILLLCCFAGSARAQQAPVAVYRITGSIGGLADNSAVFITDGNRPTDTISRSVVKGGVFVLTGHVAEPTLLELNLETAKKKYLLFAGNDNMKITGNAADLSSIRVTGSKSQDEFIYFQQIFNPYFSTLNNIRRLAADPANISKKDSIEAVYNQSVQDIQMQVDSFIAHHRDSYVSPFLLVIVNQLSDDFMLLSNRFNQLAPAVQQSMYGKYLQEQVDNARVGAVGAEAIDFTQNDTSGTPVSLSSFKGKYVLVDFWASWCRPCRMENPNVLAAYGKFRNKNFTILGVSLDRERSPWIKAIQDDKLSWSQVSDLKFWNNEVALKYRIQQIPQNLLIDPNGKIVGKNLRGPDLEAKLCQLLGCN